jgi:hypothetical protein
VLQYRENLLELINETNEEYNIILYKLHKNEDVSTSGSELVLRLYNNIHTIAVKIDDLGERLANGEFGLTCDSQKSLLILASQYNKSLLAIVYCLSIWISVHIDSE